MLSSFRQRNKRFLKNPIKCMHNESMAMAAMTTNWTECCWQWLRKTDKAIKVLRSVCVGIREAHSLLSCTQIMIMNTAFLSLHCMKWHCKQWNWTDHLLLISKESFSHLEGFIWTMSSWPAINHGYISNWGNREIYDMVLIRIHKFDLINMLLFQTLSISVCGGTFQFLNLIAWQLTAISREELRCQLIKAA
jgi:hypothetical protein